MPFAVGRKLNEINDLQFHLEMTPRETPRDCDVALILLGFFDLEKRQFRRK
jgi:hypothetical protein